MNASICRRGFTLIELLVVIGLIAVLAGGIGVAMLGGNSDKALQNSQAVVGSLASVARTKGALVQSDVALAVNVEPSSEGFLREFRVLVRNSAGTAWLAEGDSVFLDKGIYFVPASGTLATDVSYVGTWANEFYSDAYGSADFNVRLPDDSADLNTDDYRLVKVFSPRGTVVGAPTGPNGGRVVLSAANIGSDGKITFNRPEALRGLQVSNYGIGVLINEAEAFKP